MIMWKNTIILLAILGENIVLSLKPSVASAFSTSFQRKSSLQGEIRVPRRKWSAEICRGQTAVAKTKMKAAVTLV